MPEFVASIEVYFEAADEAAAQKFADTMGDQLADTWDRATAVTCGVAPSTPSPMRPFPGGRS